MTVKFTKRVASELMDRGINSIRVNPSAFEEADKAITRDDVRKLISSGGVYAVKEKHNVSARSKLLRQKRSEGRSRGIGMRKGTRKARAGRTWEKKVRSQRLFIKKLKAMGKIDTKKFNELYGQVKGNVYANKGALLIHLSDSGIKVTEEELKKINEEIRQQYVNK